VKYDKHHTKFFEDDYDEKAKKENMIKVREYILSGCYYNLGVSGATRERYMDLMSQIDDLKEQVEELLAPDIQKRGEKLIKYGEVYQRRRDLQAKLQWELHDARYLGRPGDDDD